jgi:hypothetical protein
MRNLCDIHLIVTAPRIALAANRLAPHEVSAFLEKAETRRMSENDSNNNALPPDFDVFKTVNYWSEGTVYDLETGKSLIKTK